MCSNAKGSWKRLLQRNQRKSAVGLMPTILQPSLGSSITLSLYTILCVWGNVLYYLSILTQFNLKYKFDSETHCFLDQYLLGCCLLDCLLYYKTVCGQSPVVVSHSFYLLVSKTNEAGSSPPSMFPPPPPGLESSVKLTMDLWGIELHVILKQLYKIWSPQWLYTYQNN